jgi:hypothetical protein
MFSAKPADTKDKENKCSMLVLIRQNMIQRWSDKTYQRKSKNKKRKTKFISDSSESESD